MAVPADFAPGHHVVQFYEGEDFLARSVAAFCCEGLRRGDPVLIVSEPQSFDRVARYLAAQETGLTLDAPSRIQFVDVRSALQQVMCADSVDPVRLQSALAEMFSTARRGRPGRPSGLLAKWLTCCAGNRSTPPHCVSRSSGTESLQHISRLRCCAAVPSRTSTTMTAVVSCVAFAAITRTSLLRTAAARAAATALGRKRWCCCSGAPGCPLGRRRGTHGVTSPQPEAARPPST